MRFKIGTAVALKIGSFSLSPDDRQTLIKTVGGVVVQDNGRIPAGDVITVSLKFDETNWSLVQGYWENRTKVAVTDQAGKTYEACHIRVTGITYVEKFPNKYDITLEIWRV